MNLLLSLPRRAVMAAVLSIALPLPAAAVRPGVASLLPAASVPAGAELDVGLQVPGFPHRVDVYRPAGATRAIVFLHGHGGKSWQAAFNLGINRRLRAPVAANVDWALLQRLGIVAIFPQGMAADGQSPATWSNRIFDSGQDDVAFLGALSTYARTAWGLSQVTLAGHSSGGTMTARMWCEWSGAFDAYYSVAGPMPAATDEHFEWNCVPQAPAPYAMVVGDQDSVLPLFSADVVAPTPEQTAAGLVNPTLLAEWLRHTHRAVLDCGDAVQVEDAQAMAYGPSWGACNRAVQFNVVRGADHPMSSIEARMGEPMLDQIVRFSAEAPAALGY